MTGAMILLESPCKSAVFCPAILLGRRTRTYGPASSSYAPNSSHAFGLPGPSSRDPRDRLHGRLARAGASCPGTCAAPANHASCYGHPRRHVRDAIPVNRNDGRVRRGATVNPGAKRESSQWLR